MSDKELLEIYMIGFSDELSGKKSIINTDDLSIRAYEIGSLDAIVGDDVRSVDYQTDQEILNRIKNMKKGGTGM